MQRWNSGSQGSGVRLCSLPPLVSISSSKKYPTKLMFQLETVWSLPSKCCAYQQYSLHILFKHSKQEELPLLARENPFSSFMQSNVTGLGEPSICISSVSGTQWNCCTADAVGGGKGGKKEATIPPVSRTSIRQQAPARQRTAKPEVCSQSPAIQTPLIAQDSSSSLSSSCSII